MYTTTVKVPQTLLVDVEVQHKFKVGDVIFETERPEEPDEIITGIQQYQDTEHVMYYFQGNRRRDAYGRSAEWVDKHYSKARSS